MDMFQLLIISAADHSHTHATEKQISTLESQKQQCIQNEDYDRAHQLKSQVINLQETLKQKELQISKFKQGMKLQFLG